MKRIGGIPVPIWVLAAAGALALGFYLRHRAIATNTDGAVTAGPTTFGDLTWALAGGSVAHRPTGYEPGLAGALLAGSVRGPSGAIAAPRPTSTTGPGMAAGSGMVAVRR